MAILSDLARFLVAVVSRWQAYVTGSLFTAGAFLYEHISKRMISATVVLWGSAGFFVTGAFMAWREEYRSGRAIEIRDRLDGLVQRGESLYNNWMAKKCPKRRTLRWIETTRAFVRRHFSVEQIDAFNTDAMGLDDEEGIRTRAEIALALQKTEPEGHNFALLVATTLDALKRLRKDIRE